MPTAFRPTLPRRRAAGPATQPALRAGALLAGLGLLLAGCSGGPLLPAPDLPTNQVILDEAAAAAAISRYRASHGLGPVVVDPSLIRAASLQAEANARAGLLSHEIAGSFDSRLKRAGLGGRYAAENLSAGSETFDAVLRRWQASPEHNRNMLMPQVRRIGVARVDAPGSRYKRFWALILSDS
ncbi:SCP-like extracellular [Methylobacterium sp. 4-46]|uniref:CAP domain-containing protein n=1 Tax=unclassified Methylobacterium TaxID=2615210 RepID=UPI000165CC42|nr:MULTISPECIES: CAP domain-containing protein [Methylobacterium]ACA18731.1 SCP-like extracellular [Methylobacterium sp. 4-46]WFT77961.1 CAP domain-containing protein [Methylobacterium nodulans]